MNETIFALINKGIPAEEIHAMFKVPTAETLQTKWTLSDEHTARKAKRASRRKQEFKPFRHYHGEKKVAYREKYWTIDEFGMTRSSKRKMDKANYIDYETATESEFLNVCEEFIYYLNEYNYYNDPTICMDDIDMIEKDNAESAITSLELKIHEMMNSVTCTEIAQALSEFPELETTAFIDPNRDWDMYLHTDSESINFIDTTNARRELAAYVVAEFNRAQKLIAEAIRIKAELERITGKKFIKTNQNIVAAN